ncbi:hypothetical protein L195_g009888 [Trifolium pratense]|uniref:Uncharacterized protein n=1 Tax=Trifolium pratense TaxID=57577 RepID=A0A2K3PD67_TRIPR|nr:hypothetical protein L195_g009888 [Trifolium pratense]
MSIKSQYFPKYKLTSCLLPVVCAAFVLSIVIVVDSHNAVSGCLGSEAIFASRTFDSLVALVRDPIAACIWFECGMFSLQAECRWTLQYLFGCSAYSVQIYFTALFVSLKAVFGFLRRVASDSTLCLEPFVIRQRDFITLQISLLQTFCCGIVRCPSVTD